MLEFDINKRFSFELINKETYHFKSEKEFEEEFDFQKGDLLGKGTFGIVKRCISKMIIMIMQ